MNGISKLPDHETIETEASAWIAQLDGGNVSAEDLDALKEWMSRSPLHQKEIYKLSLIWDDLFIVSDLADTLNAEKQKEKRLVSKEVPYLMWFQHRFAVLVCICFASITGILFYQYVNPPPNFMAVYATDIGESKTVTLTDGSHVTLNTNTKIEVEMNRDKRKIRLLNGEALFEVVSDKDRPFSVYAGEGIIKAVGTVFSVRLENEIVDVTVSEGAVEVSEIEFTDTGQNRKNDHVRVTGFVKSGHTAKLASSGTIIVPVSAEALNASLSWRDGVLIFRGDTLETVVLEISRYTTIDIQIEDSDIRDMRIGGIFKPGDINTLFETLESGFELNVKRPNSQTAIIKRREIK